MTDEQLFRLLMLINKIARLYDGDRYGLPIHSEQWVRNTIAHLSVELTGPPPSFNPEDRK